MFLLNNIHDRDYKKVYPDIPDVRFDLSDSQLNNIKNSAWNSINPGAIVCVIQSSRKMSTIVQVQKRFKTTLSDGVGGFQNVIVGQVVGKFINAMDMTYLLNKYGVKHQYLPENKLSIGLNVVDLGNALGSIEVNTENGLVKIEKLEP